jgi:predicted amidohydrolase
MWSQDPNGISLAQHIHAIGRSTHQAFLVGHGRHGSQVAKHRKVHLFDIDVAATATRSTWDMGALM